MQFHLLSFEGPDPYARAGGLATRVDGLSRCLAGLGVEVHLWFVGDPQRPGRERRAGVELHRWCQWLSREHAGGVYDGEESKREDYARSLPPALFDALAPGLRAGGDAVVLGEEWHTAEAIAGLDRRLRDAGLRERAALLWNANNLFGFERISWPQLTHAAVVTTVSRAMRVRMASLGVEALVIPNGLPPEAFEPPDRARVAALRRALRGRLAVAKVARWDPDKNWGQSLRAVARLRGDAGGERPLLIARGGLEAHGADVRRASREAGLAWHDAAGDGPAGLLAALHEGADADVVSLGFPLDPASLRALYRVVRVVLADSRFEPFGLVGLETMAAGGVACTRLTGEDYAVPGRNGLVLQTEDPGELAALLRRLRDHPEEERALRRAARATARWYAWPEIVRRILLPRVALLRELP